MAIYKGVKTRPYLVLKTLDMAWAYWFDTVEATDVKDEEDECYRACIAVLPDAGIFCCQREKCMDSAGVKGSHVPMDINWLRLKRSVANGSGDWFGKGGYVLRMSSDWMTCTIYVIVGFFFVTTFNLWSVARNTPFNDSLRVRVLARRCIRMC